MQPGMSPQPQVSPEEPQGFYTPSTPNTYVGDTRTEQPAPQASTEQPQVVSWEASEYIHHSKNALWAVGLIAMAMLGLAVALWFNMWTFAILVVIMAVAVGVFAFRPPHVLHYQLTPQGIKIEDKFYNFSEFRAFGILSEGAFFSIMLVPSKRFMPALSLYFAEENGEQIVDILGSRLPMEELHPDFLDQLMHRLRF